MAKLIRPLKRSASEGERRTAGLLQCELPDDWVVIWGVLIIRFGGIYEEVDFIVVGDHGVYLIEDKSWNGRVTAGRGDFIVIGPKVPNPVKKVPNPVEKAEMAAKTVAAQLREAVPGLAARCAQASSCTPTSVSPALLN